MIVEIEKEKRKKERKEKRLSTNLRNLIDNFFVKDYSTFVFLKNLALYIIQKY